MSVTEAFAFIQTLAARPDRRSRLSPDAGLDAVVVLGREFGYRFTSDELREAFARDAAMRRWHFSRRDDGCRGD